MNRLTLVLIGLLFSITVAWGENPKVGYPDGFRDWRHVKSQVIKEGNPLFKAVGGIHHIYANTKALEGYKTGIYPDGAVIVFDVFDARDADNAISEGERKSVVVMERDAKKFEATGGWGYEIFDPKTKAGTVAPERARKCHACHTQMKDQGFVFSKTRD